MSNVGKILQKGSLYSKFQPKVKGKQTAKPTLEADQDRKPTHWPSGSVNSSRILSTSHAGMTWLPVVPSTS
uniref:Uncharacterized protein n=1 Tax=Knipowitschia caucasica TaxID=637954 RepID=A0AAV2L7M4_KNICA